MKCDCRYRLPYTFRQTLGYLPSCTALLPLSQYQITLFGEPKRARLDSARLDSARLNSSQVSTTRVDGPS